ncbi:radical SAM protein [Zavarzinella formosa]|uniref:radical SAM protein n=1 Tax=Zavarzinella formosa TaxID=360055 RepID=UPI0003022DD6|nr:radical SAM protein [Zavarzinella formosa]
MREFTRRDSPAFAKFKERVKTLLAERTDLVRLDCLNPVKAVRHEFPASRPPELTLEEAWRRALAVRFSRCAHSIGVRHSLHDVLKAINGMIALPSDVYPVYRTIAETAGREHVCYPTLPQFQIETALIADTVVLTAPLTPAGRDLTNAEVALLAEWVQAKPGRLLVIDRVYDYDNSAVVQPLIDTDRAIVLYSLSKTHLSPLVAGLAVTPTWLNLPSIPTDEQDRAKILLTARRDFPGHQQSLFRHRWERLAPVLEAADPTWKPPETGYLSVIRGQSEDLLGRGLLVVPNDVYDAADGLSIVSCLHETNAGDEMEEVDRLHVTVLSNFARGYDKYGRRYDKTGIPESTFKDRFFLLPPEQIDIGSRKVSHLLKAGERLIVLHTRVRNHELRANRRTGLGQYVERSWIKIESVSIIEDGLLRPTTVEEMFAESLKLNGGLKEWKDVRPRSLSVLPIAQACQARCAFCFSHSSVSEDQRQGRIILDRLEAACKAAVRAGAGRLVITGGGEPTLLAPAKMLDLIRTGARHFRKIVLITNGLTLGRMEADERLAALRAYRDAGLTVLAISRHSPDANERIMKTDTRSERVAETWAANREALSGLELRWICVLQREGVYDEDTLRTYLDWAANTGVGEVCFKELYVAATSESAYVDTGYNEWCRRNQVPLALVTEFMRQHGATKESELPWGSPVYSLSWNGRPLRVAAYTEPSVFWERFHALCRSWNLMADGACYANLETKDSLISIGD